MVSFAPSVARAAHSHSIPAGGLQRGFVLPVANAREAAIVNKLGVIGVATLKEAIDFFRANFISTAGGGHPGSFQ